MSGALDVYSPSTSARKPLKPSSNYEWSGTAWVPSVTGGGVLDSAGNPVNPDNYAQVLTYNADGTVATIAFTDGTNTWTQTFTYTGGLVTGISKWVKS